MLSSTAPGLRVSKLVRQLAFSFMLAGDTGSSCAGACIQETTSETEMALKSELRFLNPVGEMRLTFAVIISSGLGMPQRTSFKPLLKYIVVLRRSNQGLTPTVSCPNSSRFTNKESSAYYVCRNSLSILESRNHSEWCPCTS